MSLFSTSSITCTQCGELYTIDVVGSVNADRRPDLRAAILADTFQDSACPRCGNGFRVEPHFTYVDVGRGQWIASMPARLLGGCREHEATAAKLFDTTYRANAPRAAQAVGATLVPRLTFGWPAVREKLLIRELGLDDALVELMKLDLMRRLPESPLRAGVELRLVAQDGDRLAFEWVGAEDEEMLARFSIGKELYDAIAADTEGWAELRSLLTDGFFVDMQKAYLGAPVDGSVQADAD